MACKSKNLTKSLFILLFLAFPASALAVTPPIPAHPSQYVVDLAGVFDAQTRAQLNGMLNFLERRTTAQVVVLTIDSLDGEPIESFSHQTAVKWGIGQKGKDNGVLLTVAVKDHKYRIEVGYGLEGILPDSLVGSLGREYLVPNFKKGDFASGVIATVTEITKIIIAGQASGQAVEGTAPYHRETVPKKQPAMLNPLTLLLLIIFIMLLLAFLPLIRRSRQIGARGWSSDGVGDGWFAGWFAGFVINVIWAFLFRSSGGGGWSSGGGDSGGFSGGGGDFGGGGASGDW